MTHSLCFLTSLQSEFCSDKPKSGAKYGLPESLAILTEMGEVTDGVMDSKVSHLLLLLSHVYVSTEHLCVIRMWRY